MNSELDLPPDRDWLKPRAPNEALLWIREVRLLYRFELGVDAEIRRVPLQRGLNIVWAKPADPDEANPAERGRGHDVGKTSFCRLIRYLLGEDHFGSEDLRVAIAARESLSRAWIVGQIELDGEMWAVARPLYAGAHHFAIKGVALDALLVAPASDRISHKDFIKIVENKVVEKFGVQTFDDGGQRPIRWLHVLEWLARDQECHLAGLFKWRDPSSNHNSPELSDAEAQFLARCVLDVTDVEERRQIEKRGKLMRDRGTEKENIGYFERRIKDAMQRAREELPGGDGLPEIGEALFVDVVVGHAQHLVAEKGRKLEAQLSSLTLEELDSALNQAIGATALVQSRHDELSQLVQETADILERFQQNETSTQEQVDALDAILAKLKPDRAYCDVPANIALFRCPLLQKQRLSGDANAPEEENVSALAEQKKEHVSKQLDGLKRNLTQITELLTERKKEEALARTRRDALSEQRTKLREQLAALDKESAAWRVRAEDATLSHARLNKAREDLGALEGQIEISKAEQDKAQVSARIRQGDLIQVFMAIGRYFKGDEADAELKFTRDEINARIGSGGGAYRALSSVSFDFCALIARLNGIGHHPGILIHDSPRESDMELSLYRPLFEFIKLLSDRAPLSFQYIITTTEHPPDGLKKAPHLCLELDGSTRGGKLFKEDL
jgi:hypothetical protein